MTDAGKHAATLLRLRPYLRSRKYAGDYMAADLLLDLERAIQLAGLTERQSAAIAVVYERDLTQKEAARHFGISAEAVHKILFSAHRKIGRIYWKWEMLELNLIEGGNSHEPGGNRERQPDVS